MISSCRRKVNSRRIPPRDVSTVLAVAVAKELGNSQVTAGVKILTGLTYGYCRAAVYYGLALPLSNNSKALLLTAAGAEVCRRNASSLITEERGFRSLHDRCNLYRKRIAKNGGESIVAQVCSLVFGWNRVSASLNRFAKICRNEFRRGYLGRAVVEAALSYGWVKIVWKQARRLYVLTQLGVDNLSKNKSSPEGLQKEWLGDLLATV